MIFSLLLGGFRPLTLAQNSIQTDRDFDTETLIKDFFIKGNCRNVDNISALGNAVSIGHFSEGGGIIGFSEGIIITSGDTELAMGPNNTAEATASFNNVSSDSDLAMLASSSIYDVGGIEFDFVPIESPVTFRYAFASEEYCEFVGSIFNDVFGFFVSGPGINGPFTNNAINVALLPNSNDYVSINTVNHLSNVDSYVKNELEEDASICGITFSPSYISQIQYDGFTIPLKATFEVIPCETYRIRLLVADVGDDKLDSAVFLESKSFDLGEIVNVKAVVPESIEPIAYEDCKDGAFIFTRSANSDLSSPLIVEFSINPMSTAIEGIDYSNIPNMITIPAGQASFTLPINILSDNLAEGMETLLIDLEYICDCIDPSATELIISDQVEVLGTFEEIYVCEDQPFSIGPEIEQGVGPFTFLWNTNDTTQYLQNSVDQPTHFTVTITDACGNTALSIAGIGIQNVPEASMSGDLNICEDLTDGLEIIFEGNAPWSIQYTLDGIEQASIENIQTNPFFLPTNSAGMYELIGFQDAFCEGIANGSGLVQLSSIELNYTSSPPSCFNTPDGTINLNINGGSPPYSIVWNSDVNNRFAPTLLTAGNYAFTITDSQDCLFESNIELLPTDLSDPDCLPLFIPNVFSPNEDGFNDLFQIFTTENGPIESIQSIQIFNRWGALIYEASNFLPNDRDQYWDGTFKSKPLNPDIFVYKILFELIDGSTEMVTGDVLLIR